VSADPTLDEMLDAAAGGTATVAPGWGQGRATYGGLVAAMMLARAEHLCADPARRLRSVAVSFIGPVAPGTATVDATLLRAGGSATTIDVKLSQDGTVRAAMLAGFGLARPGDLGFPAADRNPAPALPAPDTLEPVPHVPGVTPDFIAHFDLRYGAGGRPLTGAAEPDFGGWFGFRVPPARVGDRELLALVDAWPPAIVPMLVRPTPVSTMTWTFEPVAAPDPGVVDRPDALWQYEVRTHVARDGYTQAAARVWDERGDLRALSSQTVTYFG
jgi:acyl-CoA thioesterase